MNLMTGYRLRLSDRLDHRDAYRLYGFLLEQLPAEFAEELHNSPARPLSQYVDGSDWVISVMGSQFSERLMPVVLSLHEISLFGGSRQLQVRECSRRGVDSVEELLSAALPAVNLLHLRTPAAFKSRGNYQLLPTQHLLLQGLIRRWNLCFADECTIEDCGEGLDALETGLIYRSVKLQTSTFRLKEGGIPAVTGSIEIENRLRGFHSQLLNALLQFGTYSGVGIKTGLGMGGIALTECPPKKEEHRRKQKS